MKFFKKFILAVSTTLLSGISLQASAHPQVELTYKASEYQCGSDAAQSVIAVDVYYDGELVKEGMNIGESVMVPDFDGVELNYRAITGSCGFNTPISLLLGESDDVPDLPGAYEQQSLYSLVNELEDYEELYLVELGTADTNSFAYDLQDVVLIVNSDPDLVDHDSPSTPNIFSD